MLASDYLWWQNQGGSSPVLPALIPRDETFYLPDGTRPRMKMATAFHALGVLHQQGPDAVKRVLDQYAQWFTDLRIFSAYKLTASGIGECVLVGQEFIDTYCTLMEIMEAWKMRVWVVGHTSWNDPNHWPTLLQGSRASGRTQYLSWVNELDQKANRVDPLNRMLVCEPDRMGVMMPSGGPFIQHERPTDLIWSQGSNGSQADPPTPIARFSELHTNLAPEEPRKCAHNAREYIYSMATTETSRFPDGGGMWVEPNTTHEQAAYDIGRSGTVFGVPVCLHTVLGKRFALFDAEHARIAARYSEGADSVPLDGPIRFPEDYTHRRDREYPGVITVGGLNRSYEMGPKTPDFRYGVDIHGTFIADPHPEPGPDPTPARKIRYGYVPADYFTRYVGHEVLGWTNVETTWLYNQGTNLEEFGIALMNALFRVDHQPGRVWDLWPWYNARTTELHSLYRISLEAAAPYWDRIRRIGLDEPHPDAGVIRSIIDQSNTLLDQMGLARKPYDINHTVMDGLTGTGILIDNIPNLRHGVELYLPARYQTDPQAIQRLRNQTDAIMRRLNGRSCFVVPQGYYNRDTVNGELIQWKPENVALLVDINEYLREVVATYPNVEEAKIFAYTHDNPERGTRGIAELVVCHQGQFKDLA